MAGKWHYVRNRNNCNSFQLINQTSKPKTNHKKPKTMKNFLLSLSILLVASLSFGQTAITLTQYQPVIQPMIAPYWDFVSLNQVAATRSAFVIQDSSHTPLVLVSAQNGSTIYMKGLSGDTVTLPASATVTVGTRFIVKNIYSATTVGHLIQTSGNDVFWGTAFVSSTTSAYTSPFLSTTNKVMLMNATQTGGLAGGESDFEYIGYGRWNVHCLL